MSSDNILAAVTGALQTTQKYGDMWLADAFARRREREAREGDSAARMETRAGEMASFREQLPMKEASQMRLAEQTADLQPTEKIITQDAKGNMLGLPILAGPRENIKINQLPVLQTPKETTEEKLSGSNRAKLANEFPKAQGSYEKTMKSFDEIIKLAEDIKNDKGLYESTGLVGGRQELTGGARRIASKLDTLESKVILGTMANLKELSKTGSTGFGATNEREIDIMGRGVANIKNRKPATPDYEKTVDDFIRQIKDSRSNVQSTYLNSYGNFIKGSNNDGGGMEPTLGADTGSEVKRQTKDGRMAIFDAATKKFLRYQQ